MKYLLAERYTLEARIGRGPIGTVWRARDETTHETVAVKLLEPQNPYAVERFKRERYALTAFLHPALVRVRELVAENGVVALVTEHVPGTNLRERLDEAGPMSPAAAVETAATVAEVLAAAHQAGVVHCGIKPTNILLDESGQIRVTDCRVGRLAHGHERGELDPDDRAYLAPELSRGGPPVPPSDVYALGTVLLETLTAGTDREVPPSLQPLLDACRRREPALRPSAGQVATALRRELPALAEQEGPADPPEGGGPRPRHETTDRPRHEAVDVRPGAGPLPYRMRAFAAAAAAVVVVLATAGVLAVVNLRTDNAPDRTAQPGSAGGQQVGPSGGQQVGPSGGAATGSHGVPGPPPTADLSTEKGAIAFVRYWFDALNHAVVTGGTTELQAASSPECQVCGVALKIVRDAYRDGGSLRGGTYIVREVEADGFWNPARPMLQVVFDRAPRTAVTADGVVEGALASVAFVRCQVALVQVGNRLQVREVLSYVQVV